jgi:hypothetical protein
LISNVAYSPDLKSSPKILTGSQIICKMNISSHHPIPKGKTHI